MFRTLAFSLPFRWAFALALSLVLAPIGPIVLSYRPLPLPVLFLGIACLVYAATMFAVTKFLLVRRLNNREWSDSALDELRDLLQKPLWNYLLWWSILGPVLILIAHPRHLVPAGGSWALFPILAFGELKRTILPPASKPPHGLLPLSDLQPIHSEHWGER